MSADKGLLLNSLLSIIVRFIGVALNFAVAILLARLLDLTQTGTIFLLMTFVTGVALISRIGTEQLLVKDVASAHDTHAAYRTHFLKVCYYVVLAFSALFVIIWLVLSPWMQSLFFNNDIELSKLMLGSAGILFFNIIIMNTFFMRAVRRTQTSILMQNALPAITFLVLIGAYFSSLANQQLYITLYVASLFLAAVLSTFILLPELETKKKSHTEVPKFNDIVKRSLPLAPVSLFSFIMLWADTIMVGALSTTDQVALFSVAARISFVSLFFLGALDATIYPRLLSISKHQPEKLKRFFWLSTSLVTGILLSVTLFMSLLGEWALHAFGEVYVQAYSVLIILLLAQWLRSTSLTFSFMFIIQGQVRYLNMVMVVALIINLISNFTLIPLYGIEGAAIATCLANICLALGVIILFFKNRLLKQAASA